jgi:HAD superfamily hydrolase (TIGR01484 family)
MICDPHYVSRFPETVMRYLALACDYDGTLAHHGRVAESTLAALERLLASGRKLILVSGRELPDLLATFPHTNLFERVVVENGALLYHPASREEKLLAEPPPQPFIAELRQRGVSPVSVGRSIVATWHPHETKVMEAIRDLGLELQVIFNKDAVMVLPTGVNKASGLRMALRELGLSPHNIAGVGDAENDHAFLSLCECAAAVDNALPMLKERADFVTRGGHGTGVAELIDEIVATDLANRDNVMTRHYILAGTLENGDEYRLSPHAINLLIAGTSGSGKSTLATGLLERLEEAKYQFCVIDPEGDYATFTGATVLGNPERGPTVDEVLGLLQKPSVNAVVNLVGLPIVDRPSFFLSLLPRLQEMRARLGRPHCLLVDEAHHLLPTSWELGNVALSRPLDGVIYVTVHASMMAPAALAGVETVVAVGKAPGATLAEFGTALGRPAPRIPDDDLPPGMVLVWPRHAGERPFRMQIAPGHTERRRHRRKYAEGELPPERSFYFRGPEGKLNLRAQNLFLFLQLAEGVDDATWTHHLRAGEYSQWFRAVIKDDELAAEAAAVEEQATLSPAESRKAIRETVERHYTLPASTPMPMPGTDAAKARKQSEQEA